MAASPLERAVEKQNKIWQRMQELLDKANTEEGWSTEDRTNYEAAEKDLNDVSKDIETFTRAAALEKVDYSQIVDTRAGTGDIETPEKGVEKREEQYAEAFGNYMRGGLERCDIEQRQMLMAHFDSSKELRAQGIGTNSAGGYLVPPGFRNVLIKTMKAYGGLLNEAQVINTDSGQPLQWPTVDDTSNVGAILSENTQISQQDVAYGTMTLGAYVYTSKAVLVSLQLLNDSVFDINQQLPELLGERIGRATAAHFITGTGTGQPEGVATNVTVGVTGATGQTLTVTYDNLIDLEHSIDPAYRDANLRWLMNDATLKVIRKIKDTTGRPIWLPVPTPGFPATINGIPYVIDQGMAVPGANNISIILGNFKRGYLVRQVQGVQMMRLAERWADFLQVGFFGFTRLDARPLDANAMRAYQHSAT